MTESVPIIAAKTPTKVELETGKDYYWCRCGRSKSQPFCDGSHKGTKFAPMKFTIERRVKEINLCGCKLSKEKPFCDGESCK